MAIDAPAAPGWLQEIPAVRILRLVWIQQYYVEDGTLHWRTEEQGIPHPRALSVRPMILTHTWPRRARPPGSDTRCISPRPATKTLHI
jgi:hypothetical protein